MKETYGQKTEMNICVKLWDADFRILKNELTDGGKLPNSINYGLISSFFIYVLWPFGSGRLWLSTTSNFFVAFIYPVSISYNLLSSIHSDKIAR